MPENQPVLPEAESDENQQILEGFKYSIRNTESNYQNKDLIQDGKETFSEDKNHFQKLQKVSCVSINTQWRMKTQITVAFIILFVTIFLILISITSYNILRVSEVMLDSQNQLYTNQAQKSLENISNKFKQLVNTHFKAVEKDTIHFQKIYQIVSQQLNPSDGFLQTPYLTNITQFQQSFYYTWVCYSAFVTQNDSLLQASDNQIYLNSVYRFNQIHPLIINQNFTYLAEYQFTVYWTRDQFFYLFPCLQLPKIFIPFNKIWYIEMKKIDAAFRVQKMIYSDFHMAQPIYNNITLSTTISLTKILFDKKYNYKGITASAIDISKFSSLFDLNFTQFTTLLVNNDGYLLISPYLDQSSNETYFYFQNQSLTGFNQEDWQQVRNLALGLRLSHNCSLLYLSLSSKLLCRWNSINLRNELIFSTHLKKFNYYLVILLDQKQYLAQLYLKQQQLKDEMIYTNIILLSSNWALFMLLLSYTLWVISTMFKPLFNLTNFCNQINEQNLLWTKTRKKQQIPINKIVVKGEFHDLTLSFYNLIHKITGLRKWRNQQCEILEQIEYPKQDTEKLKTTQCMQQLEDMDTNIECVTKRYSTSQIHNMNKYQLKQSSTSLNGSNQIQSQRLQKKIFKKQVLVIQDQLRKFEYLRRADLIRLIFQFYKKL